MVNKVKNIEADFISALRSIISDIIRLSANRERGGLEEYGYIIDYYNDDSSDNVKIGFIDIDRGSFYKRELLVLDSIRGLSIKELKEYFNL